VRRIPLGALQEREFRLFFTGQLVSLLGDAVTPFALVWAVLDLTGSARDLGFVLAAKIAPLVVFLLAGGVFADRLPRRAVMLTADVARMAIQAATAALLLSQTARIWELIVLQALAGTGTAFFNPASTGLTPMTVSAGRLQEANALRGMSMASTQFAGPALAGILIVTVGPGYALAIDAASFGVSAFYLARLHLPLHVGLPPQSFARDLLDGWREFTARTWVWLIVVSVSLGNMMNSVWLVLAAVWIKNGHGGAGAWTAILVVSAIGALAAAPAPPGVHCGGSECGADHCARAEAALGDPRGHGAGHRLREHALQYALGDDAAAAHPAGVTVARQCLRLVRLPAVRSARTRPRRSGRGCDRDEPHALDSSRGYPCRNRCDARGAERAAPAAARRTPARARRAAVRRRLSRHSWCHLS
jgi:MFS family permease